MSKQTAKNDQPIIERRGNGYWVEFNGLGKLFEAGPDTPFKKCYSKAEEYGAYLKNFTDPIFSLGRIQTIFFQFEALIETLSVEFPRDKKLGEDKVQRYARNYAFYIDEEEESTIVLQFGNLDVYVNEEGLFGAKLVSNWPNKERVVICANLTLSTMSNFLKGCPASRTFSGLKPYGVFISPENRDYIIKTANSFCLNK